MEKVFCGRDFWGKIVVNLHLLIVLYLFLGMVDSGMKYFIALPAISAVHVHRPFLGSAPLAFFLTASIRRHMKRSILTAYSKRWRIRIKCISTGYLWLSDSVAMFPLALQLRRFLSRFLHFVLILLTQAAAFDAEAAALHTDLNVLHLTEMSIGAPRLRAHISNACVRGIRQNRASAGFLWTKKFKTHIQWTN